jgi:hypothetical protein
LRLGSNRLLDLEKPWGIVLWESVIKIFYHPRSRVFSAVLILRWKDLCLCSSVGFFEDFFKDPWWGSTNLHIQVESIHRGGVTKSCCWKKKTCWHMMMSLFWSFNWEKPEKLGGGPMKYKGRDSIWRISMHWLIYQVLFFPCK